MTKYRYHTSVENDSWACGYCERSEDDGQTWLHMANTEWARVKISFPLNTAPFPEPEQWVRGSEPIPEPQASAYIPPEFAGHANPSLMKRGVHYSQEELTKAEAELDAAPEKAQTGHIKARIALYTWALSEHEKVPMELRDQYPTEGTKTEIWVKRMKPRRDPGETDEAYEKRCEEVIAIYDLEVTEVWGYPHQR